MGRALLVSSHHSGDGMIGFHEAFARVIETAREHQTEDDKPAIDVVEDYYVNHFAEEDDGDPE